MSNTSENRITAYEPYEMFAMRLGLGILLYLSLPSEINFTTQSIPVGLAHFIDFTFLSNATLWTICKAVTLLLIPVYAANIAFLPTVSWFLFTAVSCGTLQNSQGGISHVNQPLALIFLGQWLYGWYQLRAGVSDQRMQIHISKVILASCYVTAAITKLLVTDGTWMWRAPELAIQIIKATGDSYYSGGVPPSAFPEYVAVSMVEHPWVTRLIVGPALLLELFAFLMLRDRRTAFVYALALIAGHEVIYALMKLAFWQWELLLLILFINPPYWLTKRLSGHKISA